MLFPVALKQYLEGLERSHACFQWRVTGKQGHQARAPGNTRRGHILGELSGILATPPAKIPDIQSNPSSGNTPYARSWSPGKEIRNQPVCRYTLSAVTNEPLAGSTFPRVKFLVMLD